MGSTHMSAVHGSPSSQLSAVPREHAPARQVSGPLQVRVSLHGVPSVAVRFSGHMAPVPEQVSATAARLHQAFEEQLEGGWSDASLRRLADRHPAESVVILTSRAAVVALLHAALGLAESTALGALHFQVCALDWPCSADPEGRPALIGVDLDWLPPPPPSRRAKFPGGPGSAAANR